MKQPECYSYVVVDDSGYAPNPYFETCTLAACKPIIRKTAEPGDWIIGLTPKKFGFNMTYAMQVERVLPLGEYFLDPKFSDKKPDFTSDDPHLWMGDNFYEKTKAGYIQHVSAHNTEGREDHILREKAHRDLKGKNVLISGRFFYYGKNYQPLPPELDYLKIGRFHRLSGTSGALLFERHAKHLLKTPGIHGEPRTIQEEVAKLQYLTNPDNLAIQRGREIVVFDRTAR
jgi:hypothetical protein